MSTALAVRQETIPMRLEGDALAGMAPMTFEQLINMGDALVRTGFLPKHIRTGAQAAAIVLAGRELGLPPMRSIRSLAMVEGKVVENADSQLARFKSDGGRAVWKRLDEQGATLSLKHPNGDEHEESFTIEDAQRAGLLGKDNWRKYPKAMLRSRVITAGLKSIGWEGGAGAYDPDEAAAFAPAQTATPGGAVDGDGVVHDLDWALTLPFPFDRDKPNGSHGKPLRELSAGHLAKVAQWIAKQQETRGSDWHAETHEAITLVLGVRGDTSPATDAQKARIAELLDKADLDDKEREKFARVAGDRRKPITSARADDMIAYLTKLVPVQTSQTEIEGTAAAAPPATVSGVVPPPGKVEDALEKNAAATLAAGDDSDDLPF